jgi:hypothetical protein
MKIINRGSLLLAKVLPSFYQLLSEVGIVDIGCAVGAGVEEVQVEQHAEDVVGGEREEEEGVSNRPGEGCEETEDDPVGQPLLGLLSILGLECLRGRGSTLKVM